MTTEIETSVAVGSGSGWLLADDNASGGPYTLPTGFASATEPGADDLLAEWGRGHFRSGILWLHQTSAAAVLAVPTAEWDGSGVFLFFLWRGFGPVVHLPAWSANADWNNDATAFHTAREAAQAFGNSALGIGSRPA